ncbi:MAG: DUF1501 domain-containing protein [Parvularcula sp.]|jgi:uncharacterized protein (DUF1501 family)|nr:DUF1501 domain-containing protein [Parvularcula sp.]
MTTRRQFLTYAASLPAATPFLNLNAYGSSSSDYKALVCLFFFGGLDTHDLLIGYDPASYSDWSNARRSLVDRYAIVEGVSRDRADLHGLELDNAAAFGSRRFALPPEARGLHSLMSQGKASIVANVGPLIEPTTRSMIKSRTASLPSRLASHNDQQSTWQSLGVEGTTIGWGGRFLDILGAGHQFAGLSAASSFLFLTGVRSRAVQIGGLEGLDTIKEFNEGGYAAPGLNQQIERWLKEAASSSPSVIARDYGRLQRKAIDDSRAFNAAVADQTLGEAVVIPDNKLSEQFAGIANAIAARGAIGAGRQIFFASVGGFDTHKDQAENLPPRIAAISDAVHRFHTVLEGAGLGDAVTTFTGSDFGRTLVSNATGTDHGWGSHHFVVGGAVNGNRVIGNVPSYEPDHELDYRRGALIPEISVEQYGSELGRWFGLSERELDEVFPNRGAFDRTPLGLFRS